MAYSTLRAAIQAAIKQNDNEEITGNLLQSVLLSIVNTVGAGYNFAGVATPSTNPGTPDGAMFWIGGKGTYANFGSSVTIAAGYLGIFMWDGSAFTRSVLKLSGGEGVFDVTDYTGNEYANLSAAIAAIPQEAKAGGMEIRYVQSSDHKYVQYRYMGTSTANADFANVKNWQGVESKPVSKSKNLVESNGIFEEDFKQQLSTVIYEEEWDVVAGSTSNGHAFELNIPAGNYLFSVENVDANNTGTFQFYFTPSSSILVQTNSKTIGIGFVYNLKAPVTKVSIGDINSSISQSGKMKLVIRKLTSNSSVIEELQKMQKDFSPCLYGEFINAHVGSSGFTDYNANSRAAQVNIQQYNRDVTITAETGYRFVIMYYDSSDTYISGTSWLATETITAGSRFRLLLKKDTNNISALELMKHYRVSTKCDANSQDIEVLKNTVIKDVEQSLTDSQKRTAKNNLDLGESKDLLINGISRVFDVTAGTAVPASVWDDNYLEPGVYSLLWRNVTTNNSGQGRIYGLPYEFYVKIGVPATFKLNSRTLIKLGDTASAITTSGKMEVVITKRNESTVCKADLAVKAVANKPDGILYGDFFNGSLNGQGGLSTYEQQKRTVNSSFITFAERVKLTANTGYGFIVDKYDASGNYNSTTGWVTEAIVQKNINVRILIEKISHSASTCVDVDELIGNINILSASSDSAKIEELTITPAIGGLNPEGQPNSMPERIHGQITYVDKDYIAFVEPGYWMCVAFFDANGTFINYADDYVGHYVSNIPAGSYFNIFIGRNYTAMNISEWKHLHIIPADAADLFNFDSYDVVRRNEEAVNNILAAQKHASLTTARDGNSSKKFTIAHITDIHNDKLRMKNFNVFTSYLDTFATTCILTGDFVVLPIEEHYEDIMPVVDVNSKLLKVVGNHEKAQNDLRSGSETYGQWFYNTRAEMYANLNMDTPTGKLYYYKDFMSKYRVIILNQYDYDEDANIRIKFTQDQIDWFIAALKDAATNNLHVLIAEHDPETFPTSNNKGFYQRFMPWGNTPWSQGSTAETIIEDIVNAFKNGSSLTQSYSNNISVDTTFDTAGTFVAYMCGHVHEDAIGYSGKYTDQLYLCCANSGIGDGNVINGVNDSSQDVLRIGGSKSEDCFNVYVFDPDNKLVKIIRVGSDVTDDMTDRKKTCFSY